MLTYGGGAPAGLSEPGARATGHGLPTRAPIADCAPIVTPAQAGVQSLRPLDSRFPCLREGDSGNDGARRRTGGHGLPYRAFGFGGAAVVGHGWSVDRRAAGDAEPVLAVPRDRIHNSHPTLADKPPVARKTKTLLTGPRAVGNCRVGRNNGPAGT
jgi:hypothetical protein